MVTHFKDDLHKSRQRYQFVHFLLIVHPFFHLFPLSSNPLILSDEGGNSNCTFPNFICCIQYSVWFSPHWEQTKNKYRLSDRFIVHLHFVNNGDRELPVTCHFLYPIPILTSVFGLLHWGLAKQCKLKLQHITFQLGMLQL